MKANTAAKACPALASWGIVSRHYSPRNKAGTAVLPYKNYPVSVGRTCKYLGGRGVPVRRPPASPSNRNTDVIGARLAPASVRHTLCLSHASPMVET